MLLTLSGLIHGGTRRRRRRTATTATVDHISRRGHVHAAHAAAIARRRAHSDRATLATVQVRVGYARLVVDARQALVRARVTQLLGRVELAALIVVVVVVLLLARAWREILIRVDTVAGFYRLLVGLLELVAYALVEHLECVALRAA